MSDATESENNIDTIIEINLEEAGNSTINQAGYIQGKEDYSNICSEKEHHARWQPFLDQSRCPPGSFHDFRGLDTHDQMDRLLNNGVNKPVLFDLQNSWLKGEQYAHILQNQDRYCQTFGVHKYDAKQHPESIYIDPQGKFRLNS